MRTIDRLVIHCTATQEGRNYNVDTIRSWHMGDRGFSDIGYHFLIHLDGTIERGRPWDIPGAHAQGYNRTSIGVAYVGGVDKNGPKDTRTDEQKIALRAVVGIIKAMFPSMVRPWAYNPCCSPNDLTP